nr:ribonuclease H-like domain, reverse transcriptase, RNA-dependent DNA polymerase [Tanacetum cinerariifolium]
DDENSTNPPLIPPTQQAPHTLSTIKIPIIKKGVSTEDANQKFLRNKVNHQNQFVPQAVLLRTGKVNIPHARPQPVPIGKRKVFARVPLGRQNRPFSAPTDRGYSPSVSSSWWKRIDGHLLLSPQQVVLGKHIEKVPTGKNPFLDAEVEGIFDSGCCRSMTGNKERLDDFQAFQGRKVTFGGGKGRITDTKCLVLSKDFKFPDESMVLLRVPRKNNLYTINLNNLCPIGTQDANSDSDCDELVIIVPSYPSHNIQGTEPKDSSGDEVDDSLLNSADKFFQKALARLKGQEQKSTYDTESLGLGFSNDAEELQKNANLGTHDPSPGIFSSSSYDDEFGAALNNVASTMEMDVKSVFLYGRSDEEKHGYKRGTMDKTLFLKKNNRDIILVQVYVDDIIFGSTKKAWCDEFETLMKGEFQMSAMGELTFFLVKNIFKYLKGQPNLGLWYPRESPFVLEAYSDNDYAGENKDRKSTTGGCQFLGRRLISWQCKK